MMKKGLIVCITLFTMVAVVLQYYLMITTRETSILESTVRFFTYFTILTNTIVAIYFGLLLFKKEALKELNFKRLTAVTVYITIVGLVYQTLLRHTWSPTGLQKIVDELLHSVNPILVILFWFLCVKSNRIKYNNIWKWLVFPLFYLIFVLIRGYFSNFYPYPFLDVYNLGLLPVLLNSLGITLLFILISALFIWLNSLYNRD